VSRFYQGGGNSWAITYENSALSPSPGWRYCDLNGWLEYKQWNHVDFSLASDGSINVRVTNTNFDGPSTCSVGSALNSGTAVVSIGSRGRWGEPQAGNFHYDNVVSYVQR
jgi:hypothetical protein